MKRKKINPILEQTRKKGRNGDTILAHINPLEALMLKKAGGSGTINPKTGLPEFGFFRNPGKWLKGSIGGAGGAILGNILLPGLGGVVGGALGGAVGSATRGRKDYMKAGLRGAGMGAVLPTAASASGWLANAAGAKSLGSKLSNYGDKNSILAALGLGNKSSSGLNGIGKGITGISAGDVSDEKERPYHQTYFEQYYDPDDKDYGRFYNDYERYRNRARQGEDLSFMDKLKRNSKDFLTEPKNLLALGSTGLSLYDRFNQPKPLTPTQKGKASKEEMLASRLTDAEMKEQERYELALEQARRRNARKKFLPEERIDIQPLYNRVSSPEEYAQSGRWLNYYNNPQFAGQPIRF